MRRSGTGRFGSTSACKARGRRSSLPFDALFVPDELRAALDDEAWLRAMLAAERALARAQSLDVDELVRDGRSAGNPVAPLVRRLRSRSDQVHRGATSQDILDTAAALVA